MKKCNRAAVSTVVVGNSGRLVRVTEQLVTCRKDTCDVRWGHARRYDARARFHGDVLDLNDRGRDPACRDLWRRENARADHAETTHAWNEHVVASKCSTEVFARVSQSVNAVRVGSRARLRSSEREILYRKMARHLPSTDARYAPS